eukprot:Gregarina_sp_Poly_1__6482@NODE_346_length_9378_cov_211_258941_g289_i0_p3_GENE_NODE_346_length_9378_cov_211_258941_g289_i0NODE_346_length_9378_cov_211_258941_g289_i0_p3_ORF_typecomplete_len240_score33_99_NODE_346_length_9378_cov_211_258941_g289_i072767995
MKPLAIFYALQAAPWPKKVSLYLVLVCNVNHDKPEYRDGEELLTPPFKLGPFQFGKNRISLLSFKNVQIRIIGKNKEFQFSERKSDEVSPSIDKNNQCGKNIEGPGWAFELTNGTARVCLNEHNPLCIFSVLDNSFEVEYNIGHSRLRLVSELAMLAGDCMVKSDPALECVQESEIRHQIFYQFFSASAQRWQPTTSEIIGFLTSIKTALDQMLRHEPLSSPLNLFFRRLIHSWHKYFD